MLLGDFQASTSKAAAVCLLCRSLVNYAAVAKILKKHDKLTGSLLRFPYLSNVSLPSVLRGAGWPGTVAPCHVGAPT